MIIAHDLGTTGDKASLHGDDGHLMSAITIPYSTQYGEHGIVEQDPNDWWNAVAQATRVLLERTSTSKDAVKAISFSGQMMGAVFLDSQLEPVRPSMIWADTRSGQQCDSLITQVGLQRGYKITGHQLNPTYSLTKIMWLRDNEPEMFARVHKVCLAKDFIVARLTGRLATDPSDASSTNAYDQTEGCWSEEILSAAGIDPHLLPEIVPSTTIVGTVRASAAEATGLATDTAVVIGGGDGPLAALGAGIVGPEDGAYVYLGSSSWVSVAANQPLLDPQMRTMTFDHVIPGRYVPTATMQAGGGSLQWIAEILQPGSASTKFEHLLSEADTAEASSEGLYFLPHLLGERSPYWNPDARGAFLGLSRHHGRAHMVRAVVEGVAFNLFTCVEAFRDAGIGVDRVDAIGGGAKSDTWLQIIADVWGTTVRRRSIVDEANSLGAAVVAGVATGLLGDFSATHSLSEVTAEFLPDPERHGKYADRHAVFLDGYRRLETWFPARANEGRK